MFNIYYQSITNRLQEIKAALHVLTLKQVHMHLHETVDKGC